MGKHVLFFLISGAILLAAGCSKEETPARIPVTEAAEASGGASAPVQAAAGYGYPLRVGMWLYTIEAGKDTGSPTDVTKAAEQVPLGEKLGIIEPEPRKATNPWDSKVYDYYRVRRDTGKEGLIFANQLSLGSELAVVAEEKAYLYHSAKSVDASDYVLSRGIVLGVFPETEKDGFVRIEAYDPGKQAYRRNFFIKVSALSYSEQDVQSSILLQTAEALDPEKEKNRRTALLDSALYDYPDSIFAGDIQALAGKGAQVPVRETGVWLTANDAEVTVFESPGISAPVITDIAPSTPVYVVEETVEKFNVEGETARWYHITDPVEGWVFGAWLEDTGQ